MNVLVCERCGYETKVKCNMISHLKRKVPCKAKNNSEDCEVLLSNIYQQKLNEEKNKFECEVCFKSFTSRQGKYQHKKFCKGKQTKTTKNEETEKNEKIKKMQVLQEIANFAEITNFAEMQELQNLQENAKLQNKKHCEIRKKTVEKQKENTNFSSNDVVDELKNKVNQLIKEIEELKKCTTHTTVINIQQNTIILNSYNHVATEYLHNDTMLKLLSKTYFQQLYDSLKEVVHLIYYNEQHPENHAIYIPNVRGKFAKVWNGNLWIIKNRDEILTNVRNRSIELMNDFFFDNENCFSLMQKQHLQKWHNRYYDDNDKMFDKQTKSIVEETILSFQSIVKNKLLLLES